MQITRLLPALAVALLPVVAVRSQTLPRLQPAFTTHLIDASPKDRLTPIRVGPTGNVLFVTNTDTKARLLLLDSTGKEVTRFGRTGAGPGEISEPQPLAVLANGLLVWDRGNSRVSEWDLTGKVRHEQLLAGNNDVDDVVAGEYIGMQHFPAGYKPVAINRMTGVARQLLTPGDSFFRARFDTSGHRAAPRMSPIAGIWSGGFIVGDPNDYAVALYDWSGKLRTVIARDLPLQYPSQARIDDFIAEMVRRSGRGPASIPPEMKTQMRERGMKEPMAIYTPGSPTRADGHQRIWVVGMEGDSAFADLFTSTRFIGRLHLPCRFFNGYWSVSGRWLALACIPDDPDAAVDAVVKLFRIVETR